MLAKLAWSRVGRRGGRARGTCLALSYAAGVTLWAAGAGAQASSECYFDNMRMVDAQPLVGQKESTDEVTGNLHYLLHLPEGHDPTKKWPVIVFMHGSGEIDAEGDNLNGLTKHSLPRIAEDPMFDYPFIVISPQINNAGWLSHAAEVGAALDRVISEFGGDANRLYLTGLSYGGVGTFSVGIALADRIAALMPITPGGNVSNWDMRSSIVGIPTWLMIGTLDNEYQVNSTRIMDLETSGAEAFFRYTYAFADEYKDVVPAEALTHKNVFGSYTAIGHDVWHAAYGVYCPTLDSQKTVQYAWLLEQSKDGSPFVDPRDPNAGVGGLGGMPAGGAAGSAGSGGMTSAGGPVGGSGGAPTMMGSAGTSAVVPVGGSGPGGGLTPMGNSSSEDSGSCSVATPRGSGGWALVLAAAGLIAARARRRRPFSSV